MYKMITNINKFKEALLEGSSDYSFSQGMDTGGGMGLPAGFTPVNIMWNGKALTGNNTPYDPTISLFGSQRFTNSYFGNAQIMQRLTNGIFNNNSGSSKRDTLKVNNVTIIKIVPSIPIGIDIHFKFDFNDTEVWGVIKKFGNPTLQKISCPEIDNMVPNYDLKFIHNRLITILKNWSEPKQGLYTCIKDLTVYNNNGEQIIIKKGEQFSVTPFDGFGSNCYIQTDNGKYQLRTEDTLVFNAICKEVKVL